MMQHHLSLNRTVAPRMEIAATGTEFHHPLKATILATFGLLLLIAAAVDMPSPATPDRRDWLHVQAGGDMATTLSNPMPPRRAWVLSGVVARSNPGESTGDAPWSPNDAIASLRLDYARNRTPYPLQPALIPSQVFRHDSDDRIANALVGAHHVQPPQSLVVTALRQANAARGNAGSKTGDIRWDLMEMAGAQRGHWERICPCPVYAVEDAHGGPK